MHLFSTHIMSTHLQYVLIMQCVLQLFVIIIITHVSLKKLYCKNDKLEY